MRHKAVAVAAGMAAAAGGGRSLAAVVGMVPADMRDKGLVGEVLPIQAAAAAAVDKGKLPAGILQVACMPCCRYELKQGSWR